MIKQLVTELEPKKPIKSVGVRLICLVAYMALLSAFYMLTQDHVRFGDIPKPQLLIFGLFTLLSLLCFWTSLSLSVPGHSFEKRLKWISGIGILGVGIGLFMNGIRGGFNAISLFQLGCFVNMWVLSLLPVVGTFWMLKRGYALDPIQTATFGVLGCCLFAAGLHQLDCVPTHSLEHFFWHFLPVFLAPILVMAIGRLEYFKA